MWALFLRASNVEALAAQPLMAGIPMGYCPQRKMLFGKRCNVVAFTRPATKGGPTNREGAPVALFLAIALFATTGWANDK